jgi:predicted RecB family nuclease
VIELEQCPGRGDSKDKFATTIRAMQEGAEIIYQAALQDNQFAGYADFLFKVPGESKLGNYHYEPWDTKLALSSKPKFLIQLCCYADLLREVQGVLPKHLVVVLGNNEEQKFRTEDYIYFYHQLREAFLNQQRNFGAALPPDFAGMENFGRWKTHAEEKMESMDHLCRVAGIRTVQIKKLYASDVTTMATLADSKLQRVPKMQDSTLATLKHQARLQIESKGLNKPKFDVIDPQPDGLGLTLLPPHSPLDVFFDMEGFPYVKGRLEYLFGATILEAGAPKFVEWWAHDNEEEKAAFEQFVDWCHARWQKNPSMHVYHYASYEKSALRRLMGKYGTKEKEVDALLRNEVFVDLYTIVKQGLRVGEPRYSLKNIEHLYREKRSGDVANAGDSIVAYQNWLDHKDGDGWKTSKILSEIRAYNIEDCDSTWQLATFLREVQKSKKIAWKPTGIKKESESDAAKRRGDAADLAKKMLVGIPADEADKTEEMKVRELLAYLLEFHWREAKPVFWAKFDRAEMTEEKLFEDPSCLAGLERDATAPQSEKSSWRYSYTFNPDQDTKIDEGTTCFFAHDLDLKIKVASIDVDGGTVVLKRAKNKEAPPAHLSLIRDEFVSAKDIAESIFRTASAYMSGQKLPSALDDFLRKSAPRVTDWKSGALIDPASDLTNSTVDVICRLKNSTICIQGPPGSGKTYTAAKSIIELIKRGKTVGITSNCHKAIAHLMDEVAANAPRTLALRAVKVQSDGEDDHHESAQIETMTPKDLFEIGSEEYNLIGGTAWLFSKEDAVGMVDYLFVDEAGQVSVANLVGMAPSAQNLVLVGDQMQLAQPLQGTHPGESGKSVLDYLLQDQQVIADDFGIFLGTSWRMHPDVCRFISGAIYEDRLHAEPVTKQRVLELPADLKASILKTSGIVYVPVMHEGNSQDSPEEATAIVQLVQNLQRCSLRNGDRVRPITLEDILVVAPYNMQVRRLKSALPPGSRIGSVDKFQGQEAPIVIVSMCSSSSDASPRGLEFIFSKNRLNVAISRAQTLAIVVGTPALAHTHCRHVEQMELVNLFCRILEVGSPMASTSMKLNV